MAVRYVMQVKHGLLLFYVDPCLLSAPSPLGPKGETHWFAGQEVGGPQFRRWDTHSGTLL
jgi:hypothetical protein